MDSLAVVEAVLSTLFRITAFIFLRVIPSPILLAALPTLYISYLTTAYFTPAKHADSDTNEDTFRTILLSLPASSPRLRRANAAINALLVLMTLEFIATPFLDTAADLAFSRVGAVSSDSVKISIRFPQPNATAHLLYREQKDVEPPNPWRNGPALSFAPDADWVNTVKLPGLWPNTSYECDSPRFYSP